MKHRPTLDNRFAAAAVAPDAGAPADAPWAAVLAAGDGWFGRAPVAFRRAVLGHCEWVVREPGQTVEDALGQGGDLFGVAQGSIEFFSRFGSGDNPLLHLAHEGFWFGVGVLVTGDSRRATAVARTRLRLARCPRRALAALLEANPGWWRHIAASAVEYGDLASGACADLLIRDPAQRCCAVLLRAAGLRAPRRTGQGPAQAALTQAELAALANMSRATLASVLARLRSAGLVEAGYRSIRVVDPAGLAAVAAGTRTIGRT